MPDQTERLFLELLQCGIWNRQPNATLFENLNSATWDSIFNLASKQAVRALIADRILMLPEQCLPAYETRIFLLKQIDQIKQLNLKQNKFLVSVLDKYHENNWDVILLKGSGNATHYPNPQLRMLGDIDLFFCNHEHYEQANARAIEKGYPYQIDNRGRQQVCQIGQYTLDHHKHMLFFEYKPFNILWQKAVNEEINNPDFEYVLIDGHKTRVLHPELNILFVFIHLLLHLIQGGVGMRQVCDWTLMMQSYQQKINREYFEKLVKQFELTYAMSLFARLAVDYLKASPDIFISLSDSNDKHVAQIYREIISGGNFGFNRKAAQGGWQNVPSLYWLMWKKNRQLRSIAPKYTQNIIWSRFKGHIFRLVRIATKQ